MRTLLIITAVAALAGCAGLQVKQQQAQRAVDQASNAYADCGLDVANAYAKKDFLPQDIADAAVAQCSRQLQAYRTAHYQHVLGQTSGSVKAKIAINERLPDHMADMQEALRRAVISQVLEVRASK